MREVGIDLSAATPTLLTDELAAAHSFWSPWAAAKRVRSCPVLERIDWNLPDPKGQPLERVRAIRDEIRARVEQLIATHGWRRPTK